MASRNLAFLAIVLWFSFTISSFLYDLPIAIKVTGTSIVLILSFYLFRNTQRTKG